MQVIRKYARAIAERFDPDKIILFGSYAYGVPHEGSDVDLLVVMQTRSEMSQSVRIRMAIPAPFPMDLLVRTPEHLRERLEQGQSFFVEVVRRGMVLYEKKHCGMGKKSGSRSRRRNSITPRADSSA
jgi:predicted nucleotidyltransferase